MPITEPKLVGPVREVHDTAGRVIGTVQELDDGPWRKRWQAKSTVVDASPWPIPGDEKLSGAFTSPAQAVAWLRKIAGQVAA